MSKIQDRFTQAARLARPGLLPPVERLFDDLSLATVAVLLVVAGLTFQDYGLIWDAEVQNTYGKMMLDYYLSGFQDRRMFAYQNLYLYGGSFDLIAAVLNKISPFGEYETRNLLGGAIGVLGAVGTWRLARLLAGPRAGFFALLLIALTPTYYGHSFVNPKDLPFACGMIWSLYLACVAVGEMPRPRLRTVLGLGVALGLTLGTRIGGVLAGMYFAGALLAHAGLTLRRGGPRAAWSCSIRPSLRAFWPVPVVAYGVMALFWPYAVQEPLNPLHALATFSHFPWKGEILLDGRMVEALHLPASYLPLLLGVKLPEIVLAGLALALGGALWQAARFLMRRRARAEAGWHDVAGTDPAVPIRIGLLLTGALFPIAYFIIARPVAYNGLRHFLFILPPIAVIAALGYEGLWRVLSGRSDAVRRAALLACTAAFAFQGWSLARLHPDEYIYYNQLVGGVRGAAKLFELDYWGTSLADAAKKLDLYVKEENGGRRPKKPVKIMVCGWPLSATYFLPRNFRMTSDPNDVDFFIAWTQSGCDQAIQGREIIRVERDGTPLSVVKDMRPASREPVEPLAAPEAPPHPWISLDAEAPRPALP